VSDSSAGKSSQQVTEGGEDEAMALGMSGRELVLPIGDQTQEQLTLSFRYQHQADETNFNQAYAPNPSKVTSNCRSSSRASITDENFILKRLNHELVCEND